MTKKPDSVKTRGDTVGNKKRQRRTTPAWSLGKVGLGAGIVALFALGESVAPVGQFASAVAATVGTGSCVQEVTDATNVSVALVESGGKTYCVVTFANASQSTDWTIPAGITHAEVLIVGGGGGGGSVEWAGGGGAGGVLHGENIELSTLATNGTITVAVGAGGAGGQNMSDVTANAEDGDGGISRRGINGEPSSFGAVSALGGGGGGGKGWQVPYSGQGDSGGSGGGSAEHGNGNLRAGELLYQVTNPDRVSNAIQYAVNNASTFDAREPKTAITRITYRMEVKVDGTLWFAEASFDPWDDDLTAADLRVPDLGAGNGFVIEGFVQNMRVDSNLGAEDIAQSTGVITSSAPADRVGYLEIWPWNYSPAKKPGFDRGSGSLFDFNDTHLGAADTKGDHGSFQVHDVTTEGQERTVLAWNLHRAADPPEIGLGNWTGTHPDWTNSGEQSLGSTDWKLDIRVNKNQFLSLAGGESTLTAPSGFVAYGNAGGSVDSVGSRAGSGGGGAGEPGGVTPFTSFQFINDTVTSPQVGGNGGDGRSFDITGTPVVYAGGGGGGAGQQVGDICGVGGSGGGGNGGCGNTGTVTPAESGTDGLGGGGGGARSGVGGQGGSGVVIVRYELAPPSITPATVSGISTTAATVSSTVTSPSSAVSARGFVIGPSENPTIGAEGVTNLSQGSGAGLFTANLTDLAPATTYHVRSYATNSGGTTYSANQSFTTASVAAVPPAPSPPATTPPRNPRPQPSVPDAVVVVPTTPGGIEARPPGTISTPGALPAPLSGPMPGVNGGGGAPLAPNGVVGGRPAPVDTNVLGNNRLGMQIGNTNFGLSIPDGQGSITNRGGNTELAIQPGGQKNLSGSGLFPGSTVQVFMPLGSNGSREIAQFPVGPNGTFDGNAAFTTRPSDPPLPIGRHVLQIASLNEAGERVIVEMAINIAQAAPAPEILRANGEIPGLTPGQSLATRAGEPVDVRLTVDPTNRLTTVEGDGWAFFVDVSGDGNSVEQTADGGALISVVRGGEASISGNGFMPLTRADIFLFSDPTLLGSVEIDDNGEFSGVVSIDGRVIPVGNHTLQIQGVGVDGFVLAANLGVVVNDPDSAPTAATTNQAAAGVLWWVVALVVLLLVAGVVWWAVARGRGKVGY